MMKRRKIIVIASAAAAALAAASVAAVVLSSASAGTTAAVSSTITIPGTSDQFAPPPANAAPALSPDQAWSDFATQAGLGTSITSDMTVQLGSLTAPIGPYCGAECDGWQTVNGTSYRAYGELAYGYYWSSCPSGSSAAVVDCQNWVFVDAKTGKMIVGVTPENGQGGPPTHSPEPSTSPSASSG